MTQSILSNLNHPNDIKNLSYSDLKYLAHEIRQRIIEVLSVNGGHLASNLGVVELTLALHKVFESPDDKFIWDVSHQTYVHKLLTGRNDRFHEIRQFKGLCGFSHPKESIHDHFHAGHAGTALSLALGVAKNRDLTKRKDYIIPIIGDATLTCGLTLEALNNISRELKRFIVILNDNAMSISKNVGAITHILSRLLSNPTTNKIHQELDTIVSKIPNYGPILSQQGHKITESLKNLVSPAVYFEQYGLSYIGPIDGHDTKKLVDVLEGVKDSNWPVIIHVLTRKGEGMDEAIKNPISYHGAKPFSKDTGKFLPNPVTKPTFPKIFGSHLLKMAEKDSSIVAITPAMSAGSCLDDFMKTFPERCIDVGIAESHAITFAGGMAYGGKMKIVASIYATFLQRAFDNVFHDICLQELPVVFAIDRAGISGPDGSTHHGIYDISFLNAMPNMIIAQPRNGQVLKELMESAFSWKRPTAIRYPNLMTEEFNHPICERELGKGEVLIEGNEILIVALGHMNQAALKVRDLLAQTGIEATVLDPIFVKPLDSELFCKLLLNHNKIVTIEEHSVVSGMGSIINNFLVGQGFNQIQVLNLGIPEAFLDHGRNQDLLNEIGLVPEKIFRQIQSHFNLIAQNTLNPVA
ncbi:1-deoxy-D-xylulose-5-phosphate synthase [Candidatus Protochlamydia amoebophila]|uniref:1-deoxy-D-xylulose-5-phosphate synthase n=1 Tax=Candidatus Protochlamydia amoebophila TaxID=362787 RepID=A0A0C1H5Y4_9BACT|nr:1-deoxy-D-xylulose-5-phosphate synthase [Candidatus Protochlamydia amoebophila]KIC72889.1 1-deoxy-D-xylulose-5-phosphate synthase [Candidatus Protochlamydia amoebophila]